MNHQVVESRLLWGRRRWSESVQVKVFQFMRLSVAGFRSPNTVQVQSNLIRKLLAESAQIRSYVALNFLLRLIEFSVTLYWTLWYVKLNFGLHLTEFCVRYIQLNFVLPTFYPILLHCIEKMVSFYVNTYV